jgi:hypothetical protein
MDASVQTSAPHGAESACTARALSLGPVRADCVMELTGILVHAETAQRALGDGTFVPAVQMEIDDVGAGHHRIVAYVLYPRGASEQAKARVKQLRAGQRITVRTNLTDLRLLLPAATFPNDQP